MHSIRGTNMKKNVFDDYEHGTCDCIYEYDKCTCMIRDPSVPPEKLPPSKIKDKEKPKLRKAPALSPIPELLPHITSCEKAKGRPKIVRAPTLSEISRPIPHIISSEKRPCTTIYGLPSAPYCCETDSKLKSTYFKPSGEVSPDLSAYSAETQFSRLPEDRFANTDRMQSTQYSRSTQPARSYPDSQSVQSRRTILRDRQLPSDRSTLMSSAGVLPCPCINYLESDEINHLWDLQFNRWLRQQSPRIKQEILRESGRDEMRLSDEQFNTKFENSRRRPTSLMMSQGTPNTRKSCRNTSTSLAPSATTAPSSLAAIPETPYLQVAASQTEKSYKTRSSGWGPQMNKITSPKLTRVIDEGFQYHQSYEPQDEVTLPENLCECGDEEQMKILESVHPCNEAYVCDPYAVCMEPYLEHFCQCEEMCVCPKEHCTCPEAGYCTTNQSFQEKYPHQMQSPYGSNMPEIKYYREPKTYAHHIQQSSPEYTEQSPYERNMSEIKYHREPKTYAHHMQQSSPEYNTQLPYGSNVSEVNYYREQKTNDRHMRQIPEKEIEAMYLDSRGSRRPIQNDCCCVCDAEECPCCCCHHAGPESADLSDVNVQTSEYFLREKCAQTEKLERKCCRCCRCCGYKGMNRCPGRDGEQKFADMTHELEPHTGIQKCRESGENSSRPQFSQSSAQKDDFNTTNVEETHQSNYKQGKTVMVRTQSAQCLPDMINKETCSNSDKKASASRVHHFIESLFGKSEGANKSHYMGDYFSSKNIADNKQKQKSGSSVDKFLRVEGSRPIQLETRNLSFITKEKLNKIFQENLDIPNQLARRTNELEESFDKLKGSCIAPQNFITAVCETIMSHGTKVLDEKIKMLTSNFKHNDCARKDVVKNTVGSQSLTSQDRCDVECFHLTANTKLIVNNIFEDSRDLEPKKSNQQFVCDKLNEEKSIREVALNEYLESDLLKPLELRFMEKFENLEEKINYLINLKNTNDNFKSMIPKEEIRMKKKHDFVSDNIVRMSYSKNNEEVDTNLLVEAPTENTSVLPERYKSHLEEQYNINQKSNKNITKMVNSIATSNEAVNAPNAILNHTELPLNPKPKLESLDQLQHSAIEIDSDLRFNNLYTIMNENSYMDQSQLDTEEIVSDLEKIELLKKETVDLYDKLAKYYFNFTDSKILDEARHNEENMKRNSSFYPVHQEHTEKHSDNYLSSQIADRNCSELANIKFTKFKVESSNNNTNSQHGVKNRSANFVHNNLPSIATSISDTYSIQKLLQAGK